MPKKQLLGQLFLSDEQEQLLSAFQPEDKDWLLPMAREHNVAATAVLLIGSNMRFETWGEGKVFDLTSGQRLLTESLIIKKEGWED
ncbi:MAG: hypothetical protein IJT98_10135 [Prevotella sp.]|nr:hypothetical protein [Prevotella sp.]